MKLFLTGDIHAGKSTVVDRCLEAYAGPVLGFRSCKLAAEKGEEVVLADISHPETRHVVARFMPGGPFLFFPEVFDGAGVNILKKIGPAHRGLVVMDEIGYIENDAPLFLKEIERVLALPLPVLAVFRKDTTPFLQKLHKWPGARLLEVRVDNRDEVLGEGLGLIAQLQATTTSFL